MLEDVAVPLELTPRWLQAWWWLNRGAAYAQLTLLEDPAWLAFAFC